MGPKPNEKSSRWERAEEMLAIDNGDWGLPYITHHCKGIYCCRQGLAETRKKLLLAVLDPSFIFCAIMLLFPSLTSIIILCFVLAKISEKKKT